MGINIGSINLDVKLHSALQLMILLARLRVVSEDEYFLWTIKNLS